MQLRKVRSIFVFEGTYAVRFVPKDAGFYWHGEEGTCKRDLGFCSPCQFGVYQKWWTPDPDKALALLEYAAPKAKASLEQWTRLLASAVRCEQLLFGSSIGVAA